MPCPERLKFEFRSPVPAGELGIEMGGVQSAELAVIDEKHLSECIKVPCCVRVKRLFFLRFLLIRLW